MQDVAVDTTPNTPLTPEDRWAKEFPKNYEEAIGKVRKAREEYYGLVMPDISLVDTKPKSVAQLLGERAKKLDRDLVWPHLERTEVPPGFEDWALKKIISANQLWGAKTAMGIFEERASYQGRSIPESLRIEEENYAKAREEHDEDRREMSEVVDVMMGDFRVDIVNGKPKMVITGYSSLFKEAMNKARANHASWIEKHKILSKMPFAAIIQTLATSGDIRTIAKVIENIILVQYCFRVADEIQKVETVVKRAPQDQK